jgi:hypothetical protein
MGGCLNRAVHGPWRAGPEPLAARNGAIRRLDSDLSLSRARGRGRPQQAGPSRLRENGGEGKKQAARGKVGQGELLGHAERKEKERKKEKGAGGLPGREEGEAGRTGPGCAGGKEGKEEAGYAGLQTRKEREKKRKRRWAGPKENKREKKKCF